MLSCTCVNFIKWLSCEFFECLNCEFLNWEKFCLKLRVYYSGKSALREINPLYGMCCMLVMYMDRNVTYIVAFGKPLPMIVANSMHLCKSKTAN